MLKEKICLELSPEVNDFINEIALNEGATREEILRRALSIMKAYQEQRTLGRNHIGFTNNPDNLDVILTGVLN